MRFIDNLQVVFQPPQSKLVNEITLTYVTGADKWKKKFKWQLTPALKLKPLFHKINSTESNFFHSSNKIRHKIVSIRRSGGSIYSKFVLQSQNSMNNADVTLLLGENVMVLSNAIFENRGMGSNIAEN